MSVDIIATLREVTVTYDGYLTRALTRVNLDFRRGEITGVLGAKGTGKSTVLKLLAGRLSPTEGTVRVFGRSPRRGASRTRIGYLPGKVDANRPRGFFSRLFGRKNESPPGRGVARLTQAILGNRDLLILDDPFAGLEPAELAEAKALIRDMVARGKTVILSSDSLMEARDLCQRLAIFHEGKVQAMGTLAELLAPGGAIRFLPAVLPNEIVERVLKVLRDEVLAPVSQANLPSASPERPRSAAADAGRADQMLTSLATPVQNVPPVSVGTQTDDPIDHEKLEELTKSKKAE